MRNTFGGHYESRAQLVPMVVEEPKIVVKPGLGPKAPSIVVNDPALVHDEAPVLIDEADFDPSATPSGPVPVPPVIEGERRVIVHLAEGNVKRGVVRDLDLGGRAVVLESGGFNETLTRDRLKAIFFMLAPGVAAPPIEGSKLRITFTDGRQVVGYTNTYDPRASGFFIIPADTRTNTERIYVYKSAIKTVTAD